MYQAFIIIFLLFFAVLAFGWFYWQRAKARDAGTTADATAAAGTADAATATADAAPAETDASASSDMAPASGSTDQP
jgi:Flp pilus assembly protein TadG